MTTVQLAGNAYQFYLSRIPAQQRLSLVLMPIGIQDAAQIEWQRRLYELHEFLDEHFYPIERELMFKPIFPGSAELLEINIGTGTLNMDHASLLLREELLRFK